MTIDCILPVHEPHEAAIPNSSGCRILATNEVKGFEFTEPKQTLSSFLIVEDAII